MEHNDYINRMAEKENLYRAYMKKADSIYEFNNFKPTKEECAYLQKAVMLCYEMAQISLGEEKAYQERRVKELNQRIKEVVRVVDPERYKRLQDEANARAAQKNGTNNNSSKDTISNENINKNKDGSKKDPLDDTVETWFKEAPKHSFDDVSGMNELKEKLKECITDSKLNKIRDFLKIKKLHSYFFIGPPGCGKTYIIEAFAHELMDKDYKFISLVGSDILSRFVGEAEKIVTRIFEEAEKNSPCLIFIDEVDGVCKNRSLPHLPEYAASITTSFLTGYNRINNSDKPIIFIGATNYPKQVDNAMLDRVEILRVPFPDKEARIFSFEKHFSKILGLDDGFTYSDMADATDKYNYRDIDRLVTTIKNNILKEVMEKYIDEDRAVEALKSKEYKLRRDIFEKSQSECLPTPKEDIIRELDEWEDSFTKSKDM